MTDEQKKRVYSDEEIRRRIGLLCKHLTRHFEDRFTAAMLQQLMDERDAVLKDLKALEAEVRWIPVLPAHAVIDLTRSEKYDTEQPD